MHDTPEQPKKSAGDVAYGIAKAAVSAVPVAGGAAAELIGLVFGPPLERRRQQWLDELAEAVTELQQQIADPASNEAWVTVALRASEVAVRTHQQEKIAALRNVIVNSAMPGAPDESIQMIFLNYIDELTAGHVAILHYFQNPERWREERRFARLNLTMGSPGYVLEQSVPGLGGGSAFYDLAVSDLTNRGLLVAGPWLRSTMSGAGVVASRTTPLGNRFIAFVSR